MIEIPNTLYNVLAKIPFVGRPFVRRASEIVYNKTSVELPPGRFLEAGFRSLLLLAPFALFVGFYFVKDYVNENRPIANQAETDVDWTANSDAAAFEQFVTQADASELQRVLSQLSAQESDALPETLSIIEKEIAISDRLLNLSSEPDQKSFARKRKLLALMHRELIAVEEKVWEVSQEDELETFSGELRDVGGVEIDSLNEIASIFQAAKLFSTSDDQQIKKEVRQQIASKIDSLKDVAQADASVANQLVRVIGVVREFGDMDTHRELLRQVRDNLVYSSNPEIVEIGDSIYKDYELTAVQLPNVLSVPFAQRAPVVNALVEVVTKSIVRENYDPLQLRTAISRGRDLLSMGEFDAARQIAEHLVSVNPDYSQVGLQEWKRFESLLELEQMNFETARFLDANDQPVDAEQNGSQFKLLLFCNGESYAQNVAYYNQLVENLRGVKSTRLTFAFVYCYDSKDVKSVESIKTFARKPDSPCEFWFLFDEQVPPYWQTKYAAASFPMPYLLNKELNLVAVGSSPETLASLVFSQGQ